MLCCDKRRPLTKHSWRPYFCALYFDNCICKLCSSSTLSFKKFGWNFVICSVIWVEGGKRNWKFKKITNYQLKNFHIGLCLYKRVDTIDHLPAPLQYSIDSVQLIPELGDKREPTSNNGTNSIPGLQGQAGTYNFTWYRTNTGIGCNETE